MEERVSYPPDYPPDYPPTVKTSEHQTLTREPSYIDRPDPPLTGGELFILLGIVVLLIVMGLKARFADV